MISKTLFRGLTKRFFSTSIHQSQFFAQEKIIQPADIKSISSERFKHFLSFWDGSTQYYEPIFQRLKKGVDLNLQTDYEKAISCLYKAQVQGAVESLELIHNISAFVNQCSLESYHSLWLAFASNERRNKNEKYKSRFRKNVWLLQSGWLLQIDQLSLENIFVIFKFLEKVDAHPNDLFLETVLVKLNREILQSQHSKELILNLLLTLQKSSIDLIDQFTQICQKYLRTLEVKSIPTRFLGLLEQELQIEELETRIEDIQFSNNSQITEFLDFLGEQTQEYLTENFENIYENQLRNLDRLNIQNQFRIGIFEAVQDQSIEKIKKIFEKQVRLEDLLFLGKMQNKFKMFSDDECEQFFLEILSKEDRYQKTANQILLVSQLSKLMPSYSKLHEEAQEYLGRYSFLV